MKKQQVQELKNNSVAQLHVLIADRRKKLHQLSLDFSAGKVKNVRTIHELKKEIARALTFINQSRTTSHE